MKAVVDVRKVVADMTMHIRVINPPDLRIRLWIGLQVMRIAVWIIGMRCELEDYESRKVKT